MPDGDSRRADLERVIDRIEDALAAADDGDLPLIGAMLAGCLDTARRSLRSLDSPNSST